MPPRLLRRACATLLLLPSALPAQFASRVENVVRTPGRFSFELWVRNAQEPAGMGAVGPIYSVLGFGLDMSDAMRAECRRVACGGLAATAGSMRVQGSVDRRDFSLASASWIASASLAGGWGADCAVDQCTRLRMDGREGQSGILGCQLPVTPPGSVWFYTARTCPSEGFDGWISFLIFVSLGERSDAFGPEDLLLTPRNLVIGTVNAYAVPEPGTTGLMLAGFMMLGLLARRRRAS